MKRSNEDSTFDQERVKYGELILLGYNGQPQRTQARMPSKVVLYKRNESNGLKISNNHLMRQHQHTISSTNNLNVEYEDDPETDMFQVGRSIESNIDFVIMRKLKNFNKNTREYQDYKRNYRTVSRFACKILVERSGGDAKIYAAAHDSNKALFLGNKAMKWQNHLQIAGFTTNGVLIMHPNGEFIGGDSMCGVWLECSTNGDTFSRRHTRTIKGFEVQDGTNTLKDGSLIRLNAATLLWRSAEGLEITSKFKPIDEMQIENNSGPIDGVNTIITPTHINQAYVYLNCGHCEVNPPWKEDDIKNEQFCVRCVAMGPVMKLYVGYETSVYVDSGPLTFAFYPCGHVATEKTVKYWANVDMPSECFGFQAECPFCNEPILDSPGYVELKF